MKKLLNHLLTDLLLFLVVLLTIIIIGRIVLSDNNIYNMIIDNTEQTNSEKIEKRVLESFISEEDSEEISKYINENEFDEEFGNIISSYFKYTSGISNEKPNLNKFEKVIKEAINKYEKESGKKIDEKKIDQAINSMNRVIEETKPVKIDKRVKIFLNYIYSDTSLTTIIILIILIMSIIYILNKSIISVIKSSAIVCTINTIFLLVLRYLITIINKDNILSPNTYKFFIKISRNTFIIYLSISIILITILLINKNNKRVLKKETIKDKKEEIED